MSAPSIPSHSLHENLPEGPCGTVYRATYQKDKQSRSIKVLNSMSVNGPFLEQCLERASAMPQHPCVIKVHDFKMRSRPSYYITPFYAKKAGTAEPYTLKDLIGNVEPDTACRVVQHLALGMAHLHKHRVIHANLKPSNVYLTASNDPVVGDFGQGWVMGVHFISIGEGIFYAAPEQLNNPDYEDGRGERWDVYSFGVLSYLLLTGQHARMHAEIQKIAMGVRPMPELAAYAKEVVKQAKITWDKAAETQEEKDVRAIVEQCLMLDPAKRPIDMREVQASFLEASNKRRLSQEIKKQDDLKVSFDQKEAKVKEHEDEMKAAAEAKVQGKDEEMRIFKEAQMGELEGVRNEMRALQDSNDSKLKAKDAEKSSMESEYEMELKRESINARKDELALRQRLEYNEKHTRNLKIQLVLALVAIAGLIFGYISSLGDKDESNIETAAEVTE